MAICPPSTSLMRADPGLHPHIAATAQHRHDLPVDRLHAHRPGHRDGLAFDGLLPNRPAADYRAAPHTSGNTAINASRSPQQPWPGRHSALND